MFRIEERARGRWVGIVRERPNFAAFREVWGALRPALAAQGLSASGFAAVFRATDLSGPSAMAFYAAAADVGLARIVAPLQELSADGGRFAVWVHEGPYDGLGAAWRAFAEALAVAGLTVDPDRAAVEQYAPERAPPRAELCVPLKP